ncbi:hypothetical protein [Staphylococcus caprae]
MAKNENNFETLDKVANGLYATPTTELPLINDFASNLSFLNVQKGIL